MASRESEERDSHGLAELEEMESEKTHEKDEAHRKGHFESNWGFSLEELFRLAIKFFKEMNGKAFNPTYEENLLFVALQKQALLGPYNPKAYPEIGFFDVLGNDRRKEWARLGSMTKTDAMEDFVKLLNSCCNMFSPYVTSHKIKKEEHERRLREEEHARAKKEEQERREKEQRCEEQRRKEEERSRLLADCLQTEQQRQQLITTLHAQTVALRQFPDQPGQQQLLIQQLQEQQYQQYMQQAYCQNTAKDSSLQSTASNDVVPGRNHSSQSESKQNREEQTNHKSFHLFIEGKPGEVRIKAPSMWTRPQIQKFKEKMEQDAESVIIVGRGEVLTVRVPTNKDGSYFFWEFATDYYDIAFGLYFEWPITVNVTAAEHLGESACDKQNNGLDEGSNGRSMNGTSSTVPLVSEVVPLYRRDSHEDVYAGSHQYPGQGVYLLRFDNSYSLWRSKVVYYRVHYTR